MPLKVESPRPKLSLRRLISILTLVLAVGALALLLRRPKPVAPPRTHESLVASAQSLQTKVDQLAAPVVEGQPTEPVHLTSNEIAAAIAQAAGSLPNQEDSSKVQTSDVANSIAAINGMPTVSEPIVSFEGDQVKGQFVSELGGKKVFITITGRLGSKDGYATFDPTEFKVGDLNVPVSLVNDALQKKMTEERDRLKLPDYVSDVRVENGELVVTKK